ncbi:SAM-dependent methyltransferase [Candidatus Persebacteraceae bacterium Df01]|jgi:SAM-dependent MidA family methyltransferase|uniref:SAM-dependent methyltransferase n=1 Tax=Candidatus Doriopsillibacter californiensis TaxID=2970740 RepID=A0ABT7QLQ9_9GAMM|nr:SAM-dependent methyltransferase [Candidatus Persebacteraceae bacterium Df01]
MPESASAADVIQTAITDVNGWLRFDEYLNIALHHPQVGYYGGGKVRFGTAGDFVTAPVLSPLFGQSLAQQIAEVLRCVGGDVLELGAGDGQLAIDIMPMLQAASISHRYHILETSAALRARQASRLPASVQWLSSLPESFCGVIIANEVLDAVPFRLFAKHSGKWLERGVTIKKSTLHWQNRPADDDAVRQRLQNLALPDDYETEVNPRAEGLVRTLAQTLKAGAIFIIDYGFGRNEYYHPQRARGTMMCHRAHHSDTEPLHCPGEKDITTHVDFTAIAEAGLDGGATLAGYTTQANFLINNGITDLLAAADNTDAVAWTKLAAGAQKLLAPHEMGELFKCIAFGKDISLPLSGFTRNDRRYQL